MSKTLDRAINPYASMPINVPFGVWDNMPGVNPPSNDGSVKFIKLTAGEDGVGQYNEGLLINEVISGAVPTLVATAEINVGPLSGETINLLNTENRYIMPGESPGTVANDQFQNHTFSTNATGNPQRDAQDGERLN